MALVGPVIDNIGSLKGGLMSGDSTDDDVLQVNGSAEPNSVVSIYSNGALLSDAVSVNGSGSWSYPVDINPETRYEFTVTATDAAGNTSIPSDVFVVQGDRAATGDVLATGISQEGSTLTADITGVTDLDGTLTFAYQWQQEVSPDSWSPIDGATTDTYIVPGDQSMVGQNVRVSVTTTDLFGSNTTLNSDGQIIVNVNDAPSGLLKIDGFPIVSKELTINDAITDDDGFRVGLDGLRSYQFQVSSDDGETWADAFGSAITHTVVAEDHGSLIRVVATYTDAYGKVETVESASRLMTFPQATVTGPNDETEVLSSNVDTIINGIQGAVSSVSVVDSISDWVISAVSGDSSTGTFGYKLSYVADSTVQLNLASSISEVNFAGGGKITLGANSVGEYGIVTIISGNNIKVDENSSENITIKVADLTTNHEIQGATDNDSAPSVEVDGINFREDRVAIDQAFDFNNLSSSGQFLGIKTNSVTTVVNDESITIPNITSIKEVEVVQFLGDTVRIVGAGGYASIDEATTVSPLPDISRLGAISGESVFVMDSGVTSPDDVRVNNLTIYRENSFMAAPLQLNLLVDKITLDGGAPFLVMGNSSHNFDITSRNNGNQINIGDGADTITSSGSDATINAGDDNDDITVTAGSATVDAGTGADTITVSGGTVSLNAGDGAGINTITITTGGSVADTGTGIDRITVDSATLSAGAGDNAVTVTGTAASVTLGDGADTITSSGSGATINAGDGNNIITSSGTGSIITAGIGNDSINVSLAAANINAGSGNNSIIGSSLNDTITAGTGNDSISAGNGDDLITWTGGNDTITGGSGIDTVQAIVSGVMPKYFERAIAVDTQFSFSGGVFSIGSLQPGMGTSVLSGVEKVLIGSTPQTSQTVLIVGAGGYLTLADATSAANNGDIVYVAVDSLATEGSTINANGKNFSIVLEGGGSSSVSMTMASAGTVSIFGNHTFTIKGSSGNDTIFDFTSTSGTNAINGLAGADTLVVRNASATTILNGGAGDDLLIGGEDDKLYGGDGNDTLLAYNGAAYLAGQAGNDILFNAYQAVVGSSDSLVVMLGGSGTDTFALIGNNSQATASNGVTMNTTIADLSTGDKIDLSFLEKSSSTLAIGDLAGRVSLTSAGTVVKLGELGALVGFDISSSETGVIAKMPAPLSDTNSLLSSESKLTVSGAKASATAAALDLGFGAGSVHQDFNALFGSLTDTYI